MSLVPIDRKRRTLLESGAAALCLPTAVFAQTRVARVVVADAWDGKTREVIRAAFSKHGWRDGHNLALSFVGVEGEEAEARAREVVAGRPHAILMVADLRSLGLFRRLTQDIPIVFYNLWFDPAKARIVESLRRPGGNITGTSLQFVHLWGKVWAMLKEIHPAMKRGALLGHSNPKEVQEIVREFPEAKSIREEMLQEIASRLGVELLSLNLVQDANAATAVKAIRDAKCDHIVTGTFNWPQFLPGLRDFFNTAKMPTATMGFGPVRDGGLLGYVFDWNEGQEQAIATVARILRGANPATLPIYETTRYRFAVNLRTARAMGLTIPSSIVIQSELVIE